jgi:hypothetical protein
MYRFDSFRLLVIHILLLLGCIALFACAGPGGKAMAPQPAASLVVTPNAGQVKSPIAIRGSGFVPGEKIEVLVEIDGVSTELGEQPMIKEANQAGAFKTLSAIPMTAKPGIYTVRAEGDKGTVAVAPLEVEAPPAKKK